MTDTRWMLLRAVGIGLLFSCTPVSERSGTGRPSRVEPSPEPHRRGPAKQRVPDVRPCNGRVEKVVVRQRQVSICQAHEPTDAWMEIDGVDVPLQYHPQFAGWAALNHYGYFADLEQLANSVIVSNPRLRFPEGAPAERRPASSSVGGGGIG